MSRVAALSMRVGMAWAEAFAPLMVFAREVSSILNGGFRVRDQVRIVRDVAIDTGALPVVLEVPAGTRAIGVVLVRAVTAGSGRVLTGGSIEWETVPAGIRIHSVDGLSASTTYDATIAVME